VIEVLRRCRDRAELPRRSLPTRSSASASWRSDRPGFRRFTCIINCRIGASGAQPGMQL